MSKDYQKLLSKENITLNQALKKIKKGGKKGLVIVDAKQKILGTLSGGDVRNAILDGVKLSHSIKNSYQKKPYFLFSSDIKKTNIKKIFLQKSYSFIPIINKSNQVINILFWDEIFKMNKKQNIRKLKAEVVIMAGGIGKRLKPMSDIFPKPLIPLKGKPLISHVIDGFEKFKKSHFYLSVNYKSSLIKTYFENTKHKYKIDFIDEKNPLGTIGAISKLKTKIKKHFILTNCDIIVDIDYTDLEDFHFKKKNDVTLVVTSKEFALPYGNCVVGKDGMLLRIEEKPSYNFFVNSGIYMINNNMMNLIPKNKKYDIDQFLNKVVKEGFSVGIYLIEPDKWIDVGSWSDFHKASNVEF
tara:strand:- start:178 stop:1242 length:1065 start_codon:yes stop_codon:yes gene_type:complete